MFNSFRQDIGRSRVAVSVGRRANETAGFPSIRARAPLRLGLAGGGTDLSAYCESHGGAILNATIDRYAYAHLSFRTDHNLCFSAHDVRAEDFIPLSTSLNLDEGLILHRAVYNRMARDFLRGQLFAMTVTTSVDAPKGSGLGASSALVVALIEAYRSAFDLPLGQYDVAHLAYEIERLDLRLAGGRQDQYAASFGGINYMEFLPGDRVIVNPLRVDSGYLSELEASLTICFTGVSRASAVIQEQLQAVSVHNEEALNALHQLKADAINMKHALLTGDIREVGEILNHSWIAKQKTSASVSNSKVEEILETGFKNGAAAGKVSGAGGGGFVMFMSDPESRFRLIEALNSAGATASPIHFTARGAEAWRTR